MGVRLGGMGDSGRPVSVDGVPMSDLEITLTDEQQEHLQLALTFFGAQCQTDLSNGSLTGLQDDAWGGTDWLRDLLGEAQ